MKLIDTWTDKSTSVHLALHQDDGIFVTTGAASISSGTKRMGGGRAILARGIFDDIASGTATYSWGLSREERLRVWAELLTDRPESVDLLREIGNVLRTCAANGDEWSADALRSFAGEEQDVEDRAVAA